MKNSPVVAFIKKETVLSAALILAAVSCIFVHPSKALWKAIDFNTLFVLFSLMCVMAEFKKLGFFSKTARGLLSKVHGVYGICFVLVLLPFFFSMVITNDVALITFVPLALATLRLSGREDLVCRVVVLQTLAANLGSMLLPFGNPQNLYLYTVSGMSIVSFVLLMLPWSAACLVMICACIPVLCGKKACFSDVMAECEGSGTGADEAVPGNSRGLFILACVTFVLCIMSVGKLIPPAVLFAVVFVLYLVFDRKNILSVDFSLLATFVGFFVFVGNMSRIGPVKEFIGNIMEGHEVITSVAVSQVISNVPAALLLSGFTENLSALVVGTNLGGLGTLIASMASLISFKQIAKNYHDRRGRYFILFSVMNFSFLAVLVAAGIILRAF